MKTIARSRRSRRRRLFGALLVALVLALALVSIVLAEWVTINTDNDAVDGTWGTAFFSSNCTNSSLDNRSEIRYAWVRNDGTSIYFRMQTCGGPALANDNTLRASGALDCNLDGDFTDPYVNGPDGDRIVNYNPANEGTSDPVIAMVDGQGNAVVGYPATYGERPSGSVINMEWKLDLKDLYPACRGSLQPLNVAVAIVDVDTKQAVDQSTVISLTIPMDYGDLLQGYDEFDDCIEYRTVLQCNGARHGLAGPLHLGAAVDADAGNLSDADAAKDDTTGATPDDEDGVWPTQGVNWAAGASGSLDVTVSGGSGYLSCWIDWNNDSDFADTGELVISNKAVSAGTAAHTFTVPSGVTFPNTFSARCRLYATSISSPSSYGPIEFGEVEDYRWSFGAGGTPPAPPAPSPVAVTTLAIAPSGPADVLLTWSATPPDDSYRVLRDASDPYFAPAAADNDLGIVSSAPWQKYDLGVRGAPAQTLYYIVLGRVGSNEAGPSNRVGLFEFVLVPGE